MSTKYEMPAAPYASPYLRRLFLHERAAAAARRYDEAVVRYIDMGMDLTSARDMADASVRYDWTRQEQADYQRDHDDERMGGHW